MITLHDFMRTLLWTENLPTIVRLRDEFEQMCENMGDIPSSMCQSTDGNYYIFEFADGRRVELVYNTDTHLLEIEHLSREQLAMQRFSRAGTYGKFNRR